MRANRSKNRCAQPVAVALVVGTLLTASVFPFVAAAGPASEGFLSPSPGYQIVPIGPRDDLPGPRPPFDGLFDKPDLVVSDVAITSLGGCQWRIDATITNEPVLLMGHPLGAAAGPFDIVLRGTNGAVIDLAPVSGLGSGANTTVSFFDTGEGTDRVNADWGDAIDERAEFNNASAPQYLVC